MPSKPDGAPTSAFYVLSEVSRLLTEAVATGQEFGAYFTVPRREDGQLNDDGRLEIHIVIGPRGRVTSEPANLAQAAIA
jgi:hypothetical protein